MRILLASALSLVLFATVGCHHQPTARFALTTIDGEQLFVIELSDPAVIASARSILTSGHQLIMIGTIQRGRTTYNPGWGFFVDPKSVHFAQQAIEVCDATATAVQAHLGDVGGSFLPQSRWCPWHTKLVREITPT